MGTGTLDLMDAKAVDVIQNLLLVVDVIKKQVNVYVFHASLDKTVMVVHQTTFL